MGVIVCAVGGAEIKGHVKFVRLFVTSGEMPQSFESLKNLESETTSVYGPYNKRDKLVKEIQRCDEYQEWTKNDRTSMQVFVFDKSTRAWWPVKIKEASK